MTKRIAMVIGFLVGLLALDRAIGYGLLLAFERTSTGEAGGQINEALAHKDDGIIVFGDSRAKHHIDPAILTSKTGLSAYNAGCNGQGIYYARMLEMLLLDRGTKAKLFVLHVNAWNLYIPTPERAMQMAIFADEEPRIRDVLAEAGPFVGAKVRSHAFRFNSMPFAIAKNFGKQPEARDGFKPLGGSMIGRTIKRTQPVVGRDTDVSPLVIEKYVGFIDEARRHGITVALVAGPWLRRGEPKDFEREGLELLGRKSTERGASFVEVDENSDPLFRDPALYYDEAHLNRTGAKAFSSILAERLSRLPRGMGREPL